ncbi:MAG: IS5 family transposase [Candidatus Electrothrix aestuarii]|uniref:IS5 family transposase n=1 Tax=Candidatus Electrothrix aestuarii TaxID=3062594 RepID=A0AAU8LRX4_9BACT
MERASYSTDLTDIQFEIINKFLPSPSKTGRPRSYALREILNAIFYLVHTGCQWREIPHDFPKWTSVYYYFRKWKRDGTWFLVKQAIHTDLREEQGKNAEPSAVMIDSQSVKTAQMAETRGFDGNKKVKGRKRHVISDTLGFPLIVKVHDANLSDGKQSISIFQTLFLWFASIKMVWADAAYRGDLADYLEHPQKANLSYRQYCRTCLGICSKNAKNRALI